MPLYYFVYFFRGSLRFFISSSYTVIKFYFSKIVIFVEIKTKLNMYYFALCLIHLGF